MKYKNLFFIICITLIINDLSAQSRFRGGFVAGLNAAQIDGDATAGYRQVGLSSGVRALVELGGRWELLLDILYSQKGSRKSFANEAPYGKEAFSRLNYLEVPLLINYRDWEVASKSGAKYYKVHLSAGVSYNNLFSASSNENFSHKVVLDKFRKSDICYVGGVGYNVNRNWGFTWRISKSFGYLFDPRDYQNDPVAKDLLPLKEHYFTVQTSWIF
jgi:Outer membrane protein beta-barrel domain